MSTSTFSHPAPRINFYAWIPALFGIAVICMESQNGLGAGRTAFWVADLIRWSGHSASPSHVELVNHLLRKGGHFSGYGLLGLCFSRAWLALLRRRVLATWAGLRVRAGACGVGCVLVVASCDEIHQMFLPTRGPSVSDVLLDTAGAITLNLIVFGYMAMRRRTLTNPEPFHTSAVERAVASIPRTRGDLRWLAPHSANHTGRRTYPSAEVIRFEPETLTDKVRE